MLALTTLGSLMESIMCLTKSMGMVGGMRTTKNQSAVAKAANNNFGNFAKNTFRYLAMPYI